jgi:phthalate 4,5-cis-dihydrodiol dehydrogenase
MNQPLKLGAVGLGRAFVLMLPTFTAHPRVRLVAAADPRAEARQAFEREFGGAGHASVEALCADPQVDALYIASPHQFHADQVMIAARFGKHVLDEKPIALTLAECTRMIDAARAAGIHLLVGHSHSFDAPFLRTREIIDSGSAGAVKMITALNFTGFRTSAPSGRATRGRWCRYSRAHQVA